MSYPRQQQHAGGGYPQQQGVGGGYPRQGYGQSGGGGYGQQQQTDLHSWFRSVDRDGSGQISALELQAALINGNMTKFSEETCKMMISMFDKNMSGTIDVVEFGQLFNYVNQWRDMFISFDRDRSGSIEHLEFSQALQKLGFNFSQTFINVRTIIRSSHHNLYISRISWPSMILAAED